MEAVQNVIDTESDRGEASASAQTLLNTVFHYFLGTYGIKNDLVLQQIIYGKITVCHFCQIPLNSRSVAKLTLCCHVESYISDLVCVCFYICY